MKVARKWGLALLMMAGVYTSADACTRVVYEGPDNNIITGRSMDWKEDLASDLWIFPRGMKRSGVTGENSVEWVSKYGSVITSAYNVASTDGMNEQGLVANLLWLAESQYPKRDVKEKGLSIAAWLQYVLDNFATVDEAVAYMQNNNIQVVTDMVPGQARLANLHLAISDATGDNAIFEYIDGKLNIHHNRSYQVLTNSPTFDQQLTLDDYWQAIGGQTFLPGTNRASDRFVRASYYINVIPKVEDQRVSTASVFSVVRNVSVPYGISTPNEPNISSTRWRTVSDQKRKIYYFESTLYPNIVWVDFKDVDFKENAPVKVLPLSKGQVYEGDVAKQFEKSAPFEFLSPNLN